MNELHEVMTEEKTINGHEVILTRREPKNEAERDSYWYKAYKAVEETSLRLDKRIKDLEAILHVQVQTNDVAGVQMRNQDGLMEDQFNDHNAEMQKMAQRISDLSMKVIKLGGSLED